jgi:hypothetical protein
MIYVGSGAATALIGAVTNDVYTKAKKWARKQCEEDNLGSVTVMIFGPDGNPVFYCIVYRGGREREEDVRGIIKHWKPQQDESDG